MLCVLLLNFSYQISQQKLRSYTAPRLADPWGEQQQRGRGGFARLASRVVTTPKLISAMLVLKNAELSMWQPLNRNKSCYPSGGKLSLQFLCCTIKIRRKHFDTHLYFGVQVETRQERRLKK